MKVIAINGSPKKDGNTGTLIKVMAEELTKEGIDVEIINIGNQSIHGCIGCNYCADSEDNLCVYKEDITNEVAVKMRQADGLILGSPTYYAGIAGTMKSFLDRIFYTSSGHFQYKVGASIASVRRAGGVDVIHQLNNYYQLAEMVIPPSQYWTAVYGAEKGEVLQDGEGMQTAIKNARAMAWLLKVIDASKGKIANPAAEERVWTNFIR